MKIFSQMGLAADVIGVLMLLRYGLPTKYDPNNGIKHFVINQPKDGYPEVIKRNKQIRKYAVFATGLVILGFTLQFIRTL